MFRELFVVFVFVAIMSGAFWKSIRRQTQITGDIELTKHSRVWGTIAGLSILGAIMSCFLFLTEDSENTYTEYAEASIISVDTHANGVFLTNTKYEVQYSFITDDGVTYGGKDYTNTKPTDGVIEIRYNPENPTENDIP